MQTRHPRFASALLTISDTQYSNHVTTFLYAIVKFCLLMSSTIHQRATCRHLISWIPSVVLRRPRDYPVSLHPQVNPQVPLLQLIMPQLPVYIATGSGYIGSVMRSTRKAASAPEPAPSADGFCRVLRGINRGSSTRRTLLERRQRHSLRRPSGFRSPGTGHRPRRSRASSARPQTRPVNLTHCRRGP